jgi:hypothetical protein
MSDINKSLNDLFRSARTAADAELELMTRIEAERLLRESAMRGVPITQSIGQQIYHRLLSTPLRIGLTTMTTATLITLGILALPSAQLTQPAPPIAKHLTASQAVPQAMIVKPSPIAVHTSALAPKVATLAQLLPPAPPLEITTPVIPVDSFKPIEMSPDQLLRLGITLEDNGDIDYYTKSDRGDVNRFGLPSTWGLRLHCGEQLTDKDLQGIQPLRFGPRLVTAPNGAKRLFTFENDTSFSKNVGNQKMDFRASSKVTIAPGVSVHQLEPFKAMDSVRIDEEDQVMQDEHSSDTAVGSILNGKKIRVHVINQVKTISRLSSADSNMSNDEEREVKVFGQDNIDSTLKGLGIDPSKFKGKINLFLRKEGVAKSDSLLHTALRDGVRVDGHFLDVIQRPIQLDHLIPIRVRNTKNVEHPNELIFWYEPTPEVTNLLPKASAPYVTPKSKHISVSIYPNPTNGPATVHYELKDAKQASFSIHNLLGATMLEGGSTSGLSGDQKIDLSSLESGVYLLITTTDDGEKDIERIIKSEP